jgi:hypothetical protein
MQISLGLGALLLSVQVAWGQDSTLPLKLPHTPPTEDTLLVNFVGMSCTPEQRAAGESHDVTDYDSIPGAVLPQLKWLPKYNYHPIATDTAPIRVQLVYVVDTKGKIEPCTVRVVGAHPQNWTQAVLEVLPDVRYRPGMISGVPVRVLVEQSFAFGGQ